MASEPLIRDFDRRLRHFAEGVAVGDALRKYRADADVYPVRPKAT